MFGQPRVEVTKKPDEIRLEAAKAAAVDLRVLIEECALSPSEDEKLRAATLLFVRHRDQIQHDATIVHMGACEHDHDVEPQKTEPS